MFRIFIKKCFIALVLFSYVSSAISMEQPNAMRVVEAGENAEVQIDQANKLEKDKKPSSIEKGLGFILHVLIYNGMHLTWAISALKSHLLINQSGPTLADLNGSHFSLSSEDNHNKIAQIRKILLDMGVPAQTRINANYRLDKFAQANSGEIEINPDLLSHLELDLKKGVLAHEASHVVHKDCLKRALFTMGATAASYAVLNGYYYGTNFIIKKLKNRYPTWKKGLDQLKFINKYLIFNPVVNHLIAGYFISWHSCSTELRADRDSAKFAGPTGLIKFFKLSKILEEHFAQTPSRSAMIMQKIMKVIGLMWGNPSHPSDDFRMKALEALQKK